MRVSSDGKNTISLKNQLHVLMVFGGTSSNCRVHQSREKTSDTQLSDNYSESSFAIGHKPLSKDADSRVADVVVEQQVQVGIVLHHVKQVNTQSPTQHPVIPVARRGPPRKGTARVRSERQKETSVSGFHEVRSTTCCLSLSRRFD